MGEKNVQGEKVTLKCLLAGAAKQVRGVGGVTSGRSEMQGDGAARRKGTRQRRQEEDRLPCPVPYVAEVMFHDIHPDSGTCQPEVPALFAHTHTHTHVHLEHFFSASVGG